MPPTIDDKTTGVRAAVAVADRRQQVQPLQRRWSELSKQAGAANPFLRWEWQTSWLQSQTPHLEALIATDSFPDGSLAGLLALQRVRRHGLVQLEMLGHGSGGDELDCLLHPAAPPDTGARLLRGALGHRRWDIARLEALREGGALDQLLRQPGTVGFWAEPGERLPYLPLPETFEQYLHTRSANFRSEIRRRRRAFYARAPDARLDCVETAAAIQPALLELYRLHRLRRVQKRSEAIFDLPGLRAFHSSAGWRLAAAGLARLYLLRTPRAVIAALYGFQAGPRFLYFQSGFDPDWSDASPGTVLLTEVVEDCVARGERSFEFLRGDELYKSRWTNQERQTRNWIAGGSRWGRVWLALRQRRRRWRGLEANG